MPRRQYTDADRAAALAVLDLHAGDVGKAARLLGIPRKTLEGWARGRTEVPAELRRQKRAELAVQLEAIAHLILDLVSERLPTASVPQLFTGLGITIDKMQLLKRQPTAITNTTHRPDLSRLSALQAG